MAKTNEYLKEACDTLIKLSADDEKRLEYEARERALRDYNTQIQSAMELGEARGLKKGMSNNRNNRLDQYHIFQERHRMSHIHCTCHRLF